MFHSYFLVLLGLYLVKLILNFSRKKWNSKSTKYDKMMNQLYKEDNKIVLRMEV